MIHLIASFLIVGNAGSPLKANDLFFASEAKLKHVVGPRTSPPREPGIRFAHPGFHEVWVDGAGPGMSHLRLGLGKLIGWKQYLSELGLDVSHASVHSLPTATSPIPLFRNKLAVSGVKGVPISKGKPWNVTFVEYAVASHDRLRALRNQIESLPVGEGRNRLIRSCYDWWSELDFTRNGRPI